MSLRVFKMIGWKCLESGVDLIIAQPECAKYYEFPIKLRN